MVYLNIGLKKSLLQSCPYLPVLLLPLAKMLQSRKNLLSTGCLYLIPATYVGIFSYFAWHGGLCFNLRYFLPIFPFTSIIAAVAWRELTHAGKKNWNYFLIIGGLLVYFFYCIASYFYDHDPEPMYLNLPLIIALVLIMLLFALLFLKVKSDSTIRLTTGTVLVMAFVWSGLVAFHYDFNRAYRLRSAYSKISKDTANLISRNSIIFTDNADLFWGLIERDRIRIAIPANDGFRDFRGLVDFHLEAGRQVYWSFDPTTFQKIKNEGLEQSFKLLPLLKHQSGTLVKIVKSSAGVS
jgi:hypothetical protein